MQAHRRRSGSADRSPRPALETATPTAAIALPDDQHKTCAGVVDETAQRACVAAKGAAGPIRYVAAAFGATDGVTGAA